MKTADDWAEALYDPVSIRCKDTWHMPEVRALVAEIQADARRAALEEVIAMTREAAGAREEDARVAVLAASKSPSRSDRCGWLNAASDGDANAREFHAFADKLSALLSPVPKESR